MANTPTPNKGDYTPEERSILAKRFILIVALVLIMVALIFFSPN
jgi:hypothetical protein